MTKQCTSISCHKMSGGVAEGRILTSSDDVCFFLADPESGVILEEGHDLNGQSVAGKVLVFPSGKGSAVVQDEGLFALREKGNAPKAMILMTPDTVLVFGALLLQIPVVDRIDPADYEHLIDGAQAVVDADKGFVRIFSC